MARKPFRFPRTDPATESDKLPAIGRRTFVAGAAGALGVGVFETLSRPSESAAQAQVAPPDPTKVFGPPADEIGERSPFEQPRRLSRGTSSRTPLQDFHGTITPADLHFERHHGGVPAIDPSRYTLLIHGMVERPMVFSLADLKRLPSVSRIHFLECSGNGGRPSADDTRPQELCGLTSQSEWTGVPLSTLFREVGVRPEATWFLAEGTDAAILARSIPIEKAWDDAMIAYAQNGEALRPENGYPARLFLPGWEGNANVKWLRRIELADGPFMTREETSRYTDPLRNGTARQFSFVMDARSVITMPSARHTIQPGWMEVRGIAWSGRGRIQTVELSFDEGATWHAADLQEPVLAKAHVRFRYLWNWNGQETTIISRATDETGYVQPTLKEMDDARGPGTAYH
ncbi:MAG: sulfite dehydrogenase, partial [Gemmatimonadetes bacterium]|nr:sulfite dehydrogenase [Gemmatimonadota bacterium]